MSEGPRFVVVLVAFIVVLFGLLGIGDAMGTRVELVVAIVLIGLVYVSTADRMH